MHSLEDLFTEAAQKEREASAARDTAASAIKAAMERLMPPGTLIDRRERRGLPEYLLSVHTIGGRDHGTRLFRIEKITRVSFDPIRPELAQWEADATPISEKTGKDMDGSVTHALRGNQQTVKLSGSVSVSHGPDEHPDAQVARMLAMLERTRCRPGTAPRA